MQPPEEVVEGESALEAYLRTAPPEYERPLPGGGGHQEKKILILRGGVAVAAKPGHTDMYAQQARCEVAAYRLAAEMALHHLVPTTVWRSIPGPGGDVEGSAQVLWPQFAVAAASGFTPNQCPDARAWQIAVFDGLIANTDRNPTNWGAITGLPDAVLIDHGHAFTRGRVTSEFWMAREGREIPEDVLQHVEKFLSTSNTTRIREVLDDGLVDAVITRAQHLVQVRQLTLP